MAAFDDIELPTEDQLAALENANTKAGNSLLLTSSIATSSAGSVGSEKVAVAAATTGTAHSSAAPAAASLPQQQSKRIIDNRAAAQPVLRNGPDAESFSEAFAHFLPPPEAAARAAFPMQPAANSGPRPAEAASAAAAAGGDKLLVSNKQKGNPVLTHIRNIRYEFASILPDYVIGKSSCALFLSMRYHALHPNYLLKR